MKAGSGFAESRDQDECVKQVHVFPLSLSHSPPCLCFSHSGSRSRALSLSSVLPGCCPVSPSLTLHSRIFTASGVFSSDLGGHTPHFHSSSCFPLPPSRSPTSLHSSLFNSAPRGKSNHSHLVCMLGLLWRLQGALHKRGARIGESWNARWVTLTHEEIFYAYGQVSGRFIINLLCIVTCLMQQRSSRVVQRGREPVTNECNTCAERTSDRQNHDFRH